MVLKAADPYTPYTTILKNQLRKTLDAITGENQSAAIKKIE